MMFSASNLVSVIIYWKLRIENYCLITLYGDGPGHVQRVTFVARTECVPRFTV